MIPNSCQVGCRRGHQCSKRLRKERRSTRQNRRTCQGGFKKSLRKQNRMSSKRQLRGLHKKWKRKGSRCRGGCKIKEVEARRLNQVRRHRSHYQNGFKINHQPVEISQKVKKRLVKFQNGFKPKHLPLKKVLYQHQQVNNLLNIEKKVV